jgi:subtilisin family serine protease
MRRRPIVLGVVLAGLMAPWLLGGAPALAKPSPARVPPGHHVRSAPDRLIVGFEPGASEAERRDVVKAVAGREIARFRQGAGLVQVARGSVEQALARLAHRPGVRYAEPDYVVSIEREPDDPALDRLWGLINTGQTANGVTGTADADVDAELAWDSTTGSRDVVVGVVDTGIDLTHPDLAANLWANPGGVGGCPAGTHGYDSLDDDCTPDDVHDHGSHVSGTIGAVGNDGRGVAGVNWTSSLMGLKAFDATGNATTSTILATLDFVEAALDAGVNVRAINASWGDYTYSQATVDEISRLAQRDVIFVAAAGNFGLPNDFFPLYPCGYDLPSVVCVGASDQADHLAWFSNFGTETVDLAAPGVNVYSTVRGGYAFFDGTSMATPHVTGAAALLLSASDMSVAEVKAALLQGADHIAALETGVAEGRRLNLAGALGLVSPLPRAPVLSGTPESGVIHLAWSEPAAGDSPITSYRLYRAAGSETATVLAELDSSTRSYDDSAVVNEIEYRYAVAAVSDLGEGPRSTELRLTPPAPPRVPDAPQLSVMEGNGRVHACWTVPFDGRSVITGYRLYRQGPDETEASLLATLSGRRYDDTSVVVGGSYAYSVAAVNAVGVGDRSPVAAALPVATGAEPAIGGFSPPMAPAGSSVSIDGARFASGACPNTVSFDRILGTSSSESSSRLLATVPASGGSGPITVETPAGRTTTSADFYAIPAPYSASDVSVAARLSLGTPRAVTIPTAGKIALLLFTGRSGQRFSLNVSGQTVSVAFIGIGRPDGGSLVASTRVQGGRFFDTMTLPADGTYQVLVDPEGAGTGSVTLTAYEVPPDAAAGATVGGAPVTLTTTVPGENGNVTFPGREGQRISLNVTNVTVGQSDITLLKPDGTVLVPSRFMTTSGTFFDALTLPQDGDYRLRIDPRAALTGSARVTVADVPADASVVARISGMPFSLSVTAAGQNGAVLFDGTAGQRVSIDVSAVTIGQSDMTLFRPDGTALVAARYVTTSGSFFEPLTLAASGTYRLAVDPRTTSTGSMTVRLHDVPPDATAAATVDAGPTSVAVAVPGQNASISFAGGAAQRVSIDVAGVTIGQSDISIVKPDGATLVAARYVTTSGTFFDVTTLPVGGTYRVRIDPRTNMTGSLRITVYAVPPDATTSLAIGGSAASIAVTVPAQNASATFEGTAGRAVSLFLSAVTIGQSDVSILKPDGTTLVSPQYVTTSGRTLNATLTVAGTYRIRVDPRAGFTGSMSLRLQ